MSDEDESKKTKRGRSRPGNESKSKRPRINEKKLLRDVTLINEEIERIEAGFLDKHGQQRTALLDAEVLRERQEAKERDLGRLKMLKQRRAQLQEKEKKKEKHKSEYEHRAGEKDLAGSSSSSPKVMTFQGRQVLVGGIGDVPLPSQDTGFNVPPPPFPPEPLRRIPSPPRHPFDKPLDQIPPPPPKPKQFQGAQEAPAAAASPSDRKSSNMQKATIDMDKFYQQLGKK